MSSEASVPAGHVLESFLDEHQEIRAFLTRLVEETKGGVRVEEARRLLEGLRFAAEHEALEEDVLFPLLRQRGVRNSPNLFVAEHAQLRGLRARLREALKPLAAGERTSRETPLEVLEQVRAYVARYREHLEQEEATIYQAAAARLVDTELWSEVRAAKAARIGQGE